MRIDKKVVDLIALADQLSSEYPEDFDLIADTLEGEGLDEILGYLLDKIADDEDMVIGLMNRESEMRERQKRLSKRIDHHRSTIQDILEKTGLKKFEMAEATFSLREQSPKLVIDNEKEIPEGFFQEKVSYVLDKQMLKDELAFHPVSGAHMADARPSLTIRRK